MIKIYIILIILFNINVCSGQQLPLNKQNDCKTSGFSELKLDNVSVKLLGSWVYNYSYYEDTCFFLTDLGDLSNNYSFKKADTSLIRSTLPKLYSFGYGKMLFGLVSYHDSKPFGVKSYVIANNNSLNFIRITHYVGNGPGKAYTYLLESINRDTLVISNERYYNLEGRKIASVRHVYMRQEKE